MSVRSSLFSESIFRRKYYLGTRESNLHADANHHGINIIIQRHKDVWKNVSFSHARCDGTPCKPGSYRGLSRAVEEGVEGVAEVLADGLRVAPPKERVRLVHEQEEALAARLEPDGQAYGQQARQAER